MPFFIKLFYSKSRPTVKWGGYRDCPLDKYDLCCIIKGYLDRKSEEHAKFKGNMPSIEYWVSFFLG